MVFSLNVTGSFEDEIIRVASNRCKVSLLWLIAFEVRERNP